MPRPKSFLKSISVDVASRKHNCQHSSSHTILKGDRRLKFKIERAYEHYCIACAIAFIESDINKLTEIKKHLLGTEEQVDKNTGK